MSIEELTKLIPPPASPSCPGSQKQWQAFETALGTRLPQDYKKFIQTYGAGGFYRYLNAVNPFCPRGEYLRWKEEILGHYKDVQRVFPGDCPYGVFPEPGGLLPWGGDEDAHLYYWLTVGEPDAWTVVGYSKGGVHEEFPVSMTGFLAGWVTRKISPGFIAEDVIGRNEPPFRPLPAKKPRQRRKKGK